MSDMRNLFAFLVLLIWLTFGAWFYTCKVKNLCYNLSDNRVVAKTDVVEEINPADLKKAYSSVFNAEKDLEIVKSKATIGINDEFQNSVDGIAHFLKTHPKTKLNITGRYQEDEENDSNYENIGLARAELIKIHMKNKGVSEEQLIVTSDIDNEMFDENGVAANSSVIDFKFSEEYEDLNESDIKSAYKSTFAIQEYVYFNKDSSKVQLRDKFDEALEGISYYLNRNNDQDLRLALNFENGEDSNLADMDIGLLRAYNLKQKLVGKGLQKSRILINSEQGYGIYDENNISKPEAINFNFIFPDVSNEDKLAEMQIERKLETQLTEAMRSPVEDAAKDSIYNVQNANPDLEVKIEKSAYINFEFGSSDIQENDTFEKAMEDLKLYLKANPQKQVEIIGHTCNLGDNDFNVMLGNRRANATKELLESYGISPAKMKVKSKGAYVPAFSNDTKEGRIKNRRVEIDIK